MESVDRKPVAIALLCYVAVTAILTYPTILSPIEVVIGHEQASVACHVWILWWAQHHLSDIVSPLLFFPYGADIVQLYGSDLLGPPILGQLPLPPSLLHNLWVAVLMIVGAMGARQLALFSGVSNSAALVAGIIFVSAPFFQHEMLNGTSELLSTGLLPWYTWLLLAIFQRPTVGRGVAIGVVAGLALTASAYNPFFMLVITLPVLGHRLASKREPLFGAEMWIATAAAFAVFSLFLTYVGWLHYNHGAGETFSRRTDWLDITFALPDSYAGLFHWIDPRDAEIPKQMSLPDGSAFEYWTTCTVYIGWIALGATIWGWKESKSSSVSALRWVLVIALLIALGPYLRWTDQVLTILGHPITLPAATIGLVFPPFAITAIHAYRYSAVVMLAISVLAVRKMKSPWWGALILLEVLFWAPQPWPAATMEMPNSVVLEQLSERPAGAVFTYPIAKENLHDLGQVLLAQTVHGKPIHDGGIHRRAGEQSVQLFTENFVVDELSHRSGPVYPSKREALAGFQDLKAKGYRYLLTPADQQEAVLWGIGVLGLPLQQDDEWCLWEL